jgi:phytoene dehydrogenase-like protein
MSEFDVVVIGAGHNGLTLAAYLAKAGLSVGVFEKRDVIGGGLCTEQLGYPGFLHNMHSNFHLWPDFAPAWDDLEIEKFGMRYVHPSIPWSAPLSNGKAILLHNQTALTVKSFAKFSKRDASTYEKIKPDLDKVFRKLVLATLYSVPKSENPEAEKLLDKLSWFNRNWFSKDLFQVADELFEDETIKSFILANIWFAGWAPDYEKMGDLVPTFIGIANHMYLPVGGTAQLAHTLARIIAHYGGKIYPSCETGKILVDSSGRASGIELSSTSPLHSSKKVTAKKAVVSATDVFSTFMQLLDESSLTSDARKKAQKFSFAGNALFNVHFELNEPPKYRSNDVLVNKGWSQDIGYETYHDLREDLKELSAGRFPRVPRYEAGVNSLFDPSYAPPGKHVAIAYREMPNTDKFQGGKDGYESAAEEYADQVQEKWHEYAPNMTKDNVIARFNYSAFDYAGKIVSMRTGNWSLGKMDYAQSNERRPFPGYADYRTPIRGLYMCSSSCHPGGSIFLAAGYNAAGVLLEDLRLHSGSVSR